MKVKGFIQFINEEEKIDIISFRAQKEALDSLLQFNLISDVDYRKHLRELIKNSNKIETVEFSSQTIKAAISSPEFKKLTDLGLVNVSTPTQILNGNLILARPGYDRGQNYALGFFGDTRTIRRLTPKRRFKGYWGGFLTLDSKLKQLDRNLPLEQFYRLSMQWAADHLNFEIEDFPSKERTAKDYFKRSLN